MSQPCSAVAENKVHPGTISVLIPSYGHAQYIEQTLQSMFAQTRAPLEIIVINDGSPDHTTQVVQPYLDRITYIEQKNQGVVRTLNQGIERCRGEYIFAIASDDWLEPHALHMLGDQLDAHPDVGMVYGGVRIVDQHGQDHPDQRVVPHLIGKHRNTENLIRGNSIPAPTVMCRRQALIDAGLYQDYPFCQDWAMWLSIALNGWYLYGVEQKLACYRRHSNNLTNTKNAIPALKDEARMIGDLFLKYRQRLSDQEAAAFMQSRTHLSRKLGWSALALGQRELARQAFATVIQAHADLNGIAGLLLSTFPRSFYLSMKRAFGGARI